MAWLLSGVLTPTPDMHIAVAEYRVRADCQPYDAASELSIQPGEGSANETMITRHNLLVTAKGESIGPIMAQYHRVHAAVS
jgi:hypothetical protein